MPRVPRTTRVLDASIQSCAAQHVAPEHLHEAAGAYAQHLRDGGHDVLPITAPVELHALGPRHPANAAAFFKKYAAENPGHAIEKPQPKTTPRKPY